MSFPSNFVFLPFDVLDIAKCQVAFEDIGV
jgi:hypothetical protein